MNVIVLGATGMLGRYVYSYLFDKYDVIGVSRRLLDAELFRHNSFESQCVRKNDVVINCIGLIKQHKNILSSQYIAVNSLFPHLMANRCEEVGAKFIHITTDCVFSGKDGNYSEDSFHDAEDMYGRSKSFGEPENATVVRTSIIGEELKGKLSLLEWAKSNSGKTVNGFTNHWWNGITCLQFAKLCEKIINDNLYWRGVNHVFSNEIVSKYELLKMISDAYSLNLNVVPVEAQVYCNRSLTTVRRYDLTDVPNVFDQICEMKEFYKVLKEGEV